MTIIHEREQLMTNVESALTDLRSDFHPKDFISEPDKQGGAFVRFGPVELNDIYIQRETWIGGHIPAQIPYADIYPIFIRGDLKRADGKPLVAPITNGHTFMGLPAVQVSRRTNNRDASVETVKMKFKKVLQWVNEQR